VAAYLNILRSYGRFLDFKGSSINHLIYSVISPIIRNFRRITGQQNAQLKSEKEILSKGEDGGSAVVDLISERSFILETGTHLVGKAMGGVFWP